MRWTKITAARWFLAVALPFTSTRIKFRFQEPYRSNRSIPYGASKQAAEVLLADLAGCSNKPELIQACYESWRIARFRYLNPVGAHPSGQIGEDTYGIPNNLFPFITHLAVGRRPVITMFDDDWSTPDGTGVGEYIHVMDLAEGHREALHSLLSSDPQLLTLNLGSVRVQAF